MKRIACLFIGTLGWFTLQAAGLLMFDFPGPDPAGDATVPVIEHLAVSPFARVNVGVASQADLFSSSQWTQAGALDPTEYVGFTLEPESGWQLVLDTITWDTSRSSTGPQWGQVALFRNGQSLLTSDPFAITTTLGSQSLDLADFIGDAGDLLEFRFHGWNATGTGNLRLDNVTVNGSLTAIPEPSSLGLMASAALGWLAWRRRGSFVPSLRSASGRGALGFGFGAPALRRCLRQIRLVESSPGSDKRAWTKSRWRV
ncbi:MAG TPA: PEP-CTERM sorting domain-containing protein [Verrucomicrobiota bacterium]|nr:PEP-CTERM sorting domain-containing protein [Verrucomicrobiota bacterium]HNU52292.1 PEP-CTERM sorting domain-containing protein [Verrucomicrobiota bacterium]